MSKSQNPFKLFMYKSVKYSIIGMSTFLTVKTFSEKVNTSEASAISLMTMFTTALYDHTHNVLTK
jgi:hypothetical protein